jgi:hypothetical protein
MLCQLSYSRSTSVPGESNANGGESQRSALGVDLQRRRAAEGRARPSYAPGTGGGSTVSKR